MEVGKLKERIEIQQLSVSTSALTGEQVQSWGSLGMIWAMKKPKSGDEKESDGTFTQTQKIEFVIRYNADIDNNAANYRVVYNSKILNVVSAEEMIGEGWKMWMELKCELKSNQ